MKKSHPFSLWAIALSVPSFATITPTVEPSGSATVTQATPGQVEVVFDSETTDSRVFLRGSANDSLVLTVSNTSASKTLYLVIGHENFPTQTMGSIAGMFYGGQTGRPIVIEELRVTGNVLDILGSSVLLARIGGDLGQSNGGLLLFAPSGGGAASAVDIQVTGNLVGDVSVAGGGIDFLQVLGSGGIGSLTNKRSIKTRDAIKHIDVPNGAIHADILPGGFSGGSAPDIGRIFAKFGVFQATRAGITCRKFANIAGAGNPPGVFTTGNGSYSGDFGANITLSEALEAGHEIIIGGHFTTGHTISLPAVSGSSGGLRGQITFNNLGESYVWGGDVKIGGTTLTNEPYYTNTAASIGGGSAGLATFNVHNSSCVPPHGASVPAEIPTINCEVECCPIFTKVSLKFYGAVTLAGASPHVTVERYYEAGGFFVPVGWGVATTYPSSGSHHVVEVKHTDGAFWTPGFYRIKPITGKITSQGVVGPPNVVPFVYYFTLTACDQDGLRGFFDQNGDALVDAADVAAWGASPTNLNADSIVNGDDLYKLYLAALAFPEAPSN